MRIDIIGRLFACLTILMFSVTGCGRPQQYGAISNAKPANVSRILTAPADYAGAVVQLKGRIVAECPSGCWFELQEGNAVIHVDIAPSGLAIPQKVGSKVLVEGTVEVKDGKTMVIGRGVEIQ